MMRMIVFLDVILTWCKKMERKTVLVNTAARDAGKVINRNYHIIR